MAQGGSLAMNSPAGRWVLVTAVLGSSIAFLDGTVVTVALPDMGRDLGASVAGLQWTINAYTLTLAALLLTGGVLGDRYGRRRVFIIGAIAFGVTSLLCAMSVNIGMLVTARALQGVAAALLTPTSLALLQALFQPSDRARAIGAWSGLTGVATAIGPFLGGWLVDRFSWNWVFGINVPFVVAVVILALRTVPESRDDNAPRHVDALGAALLALGLAGLTYSLIAAGETDRNSSVVAITGATGVLLLAVFILVERRVAEPMISIDLFKTFQFSAANAVTFFVYGALGIIFVLVVMDLQIASGYSAIAAGASMLPVTLLLLVLSSRAGAWGQRIGPRIPMTIGPLISAVGVMLLARTGTDASYLVDVLPGALILGLGLAATVAPLTATVLAAAPDRHAGLASGVNNAVARTAGLLTFAIVPALVGLSGEAYLDPEKMSDAYESAMWFAAGLLVIGGVVAWFTVRNPAAVESLPAACPVNAPQLDRAVTD